MGLSELALSAYASLPLTARLPRAALAARWTSVSCEESRKRMGSSVSRPTGRISFSVISANARAALRWRSTFSEKESVVSALSGLPLKKLVVVRSIVYQRRTRAAKSQHALSRNWRRSATASRSTSSSRGSRALALPDETGASVSRLEDLNRRRARTARVAAACNCAHCR